MQANLDVLSKVKTKKYSRPLAYFLCIPSFVFGTFVILLGWGLFVAVSIGIFMGIDNLTKNFDKKLNRAQVVLKEKQEV